MCLKQSAEHNLCGRGSNLVQHAGSQGKHLTLCTVSFQRVQKTIQLNTLPLIQLLRSFLVKIASLEVSIPDCLDGWGGCVENIWFRAHAISRDMICEYNLGTLIYKVFCMELTLKHTRQQIRLFFAIGST